ncbi:hypothetical protein M422DRAFT_28935, partial [Sphaerobolus stellatus SS14]
MFAHYPQRQSYPYFHYNGDYDDYLRALAAQQAREREEARYRAQLQEAARRRAYEEQLARARAQAEAERRRRSIYNPFFGYEDDYEPYTSFVQPQSRASYRTPVYMEPEEGEYDPYLAARGRPVFLEDLMQQKMAEKEWERQARAVSYMLRSF